jgi:hypothetical protein
MPLRRWIGLCLTSWRLPPGPRRDLQQCPFRRPRLQGERQLTWELRRPAALQMCTRGCKTSMPEARCRSPALSNACGNTWVQERMYQEALHHGYLNPNLPPPGHYLWRCRSAVWTLAPRAAEKVLR